MSSRDPFIVELKRLRSFLTEDLKEEVTLIGGIAPSLYSEVDRVGLRATKDIDLTITATTHISWQLITHKFEERGFVTDPEGPICRYKQEGLIVDIIPSDPSAVGFAPSQWFEKIHGNRIHSPEVDLYVVAPRLFLALKAEAHNDRGTNLAHPMSKDLEDIVVVLANVDGLAQTVAARAGETDEFVDDFLRMVFANDAGLETFCMYFPGDEATQSFAESLFEKVSRDWDQADQAPSKTSKPKT